MSGVPNPALIPSGPLAPVAPVQSPARGNRAATAPTGPSFSEVLAKQASALEPPRFSRHALDRLARRGIDLSDQTMGRLAGGVARAAAKGSRDSVVFVDGTAFVVSVKNNTVITAVGSEHMKDQVFTNIDSAVIA
jgi:flagellar operon protein